MFAKGFGFGLAKVFASSEHMPFQPPTPSTTWSLLPVTTIPAMADCRLRTPSLLLYHHLNRRAHLPRILCGLTPVCRLQCVDSRFLRVRYWIHIALFILKNPMLFLLASSHSCDRMTRSCSGSLHIATGAPRSSPVSLYRATAQCCPSPSTCYFQLPSSFMQALPAFA